MASPIGLKFFHPKNLKPQVSSCGGCTLKISSCGLRNEKRKLMWRSRVLSTEAIQAVQSLKLAKKSPPLTELQRQNQFYLALKITHKQTADVLIPSVSCKRTCLSLKTEYRAQQFRKRVSAKHFFAAEAVSSGVEDIKVSSSQFEDYSITTTSTNNANELKISVEVCGAKTEEIFYNVFSKMVADAQPIPGFRRVKGGKTPDIPRDILLEILGPSKVYKQVIKKVINSIVAEYVEKEGLTVSKDLRVEQSIEDLEDTFEPGDEFRFDAIVKCQET